jgi:hypothetical protein
MTKLTVLIIARHQPMMVHQGNFFIIFFKIIFYVLFCFVLFCFVLYFFLLIYCDDIYGEKIPFFPVSILTSICQLLITECSSIAVYAVRNISDNSSSPVVFNRFGLFLSYILLYYLLYYSSFCLVLILILILILC